MLKTAALILNEVQPILQTYFVHYRQKANELEKSLAVIPLGASLIALAELYIRLQQQGKVKIGPEVSSLEDIRRLRGNYFPEKAIDALSFWLLINAGKTSFVDITGGKGRKA